MKKIEQMEKEYGITKMEKKYGITIRDDSFYNPTTGKTVECYRIYTADGCPWENGLTFRGLQAECKQHGDEFISIAKKVRERHGMEL